VNDGVVVLPRGETARAAAGALRRLRLLLEAGRVAIRCFKPSAPGINQRGTALGRHVPSEPPHAICGKRGGGGGGGVK
jgi:hypothetical protein